MNVNIKALDWYQPGTWGTYSQSVTPNKAKSWQSTVSAGQADMFNNDCTEFTQLQVSDKIFCLQLQSFKVISSEPK